MIEVYKILNQCYDPAVNIEFQLRVGPTRGNRLKSFKLRCRTRLWQGVFHVRVVNIWNSLPNSVVEAKTLASFERRLDKHWMGQPIKYNFETLVLTDTPGQGPPNKESDEESGLSIDTDLDI
ncbi:hypothetical protein Pmani_026487 [Petrolisthes manimaculis]|uniref:Uncharacterized protein n=1 Tax=Petrolisthes manimaculis TaxID=1843537 RepID=A0AAE1TXD6_9EUCA|nr:hypothetical protein Pmani_026487 [Petrolisthes manimaculis]